MRVLFALAALIWPVALAPPALAQDAGAASQERCTPSRRQPCPTAAEILAAANAAARQGPARADFAGARQIYAYAAGALYELNASTNHVSAILLEPGEAVTAIAAGDTARWMVSEAEAEAASEPRAIVLVKPLAVGARTNIMIITDRRTYAIEAHAGGGAAYAAEIAWSYPAEPERAAASIGRLNFAYRVRTIRGARPLWSPARVFDDGARTYVEFAPGVGVHDMPPLFVIGAEGAELVNYRVAGGRIIVDRLFERAELRLGARSPVIVRIERDPALLHGDDRGERR